MTAIRRNWWMLLLIAVCAVIVMASVIDDHSAVLKNKSGLFHKKDFIISESCRVILYRNREKWLPE